MDATATRLIAEVSGCEWFHAYSVKKTTLCTVVVGPIVCASLVRPSSGINCETSQRSQSTECGKRKAELEETFLSYLPDHDDYRNASDEPSLEST